MPGPIDHEALAFAELLAAAAADSTEDRKRHLDRASIHAFDGEKAVAATATGAHAHPMTEDEATHRLGEALNHLHAFAATFSPGDYVDEESALTTDDLNLILDVAEKIHGIAKAAPKL